MKVTHGFLSTKVFFVHRNICVGLLHCGGVRREHLRHDEHIGALELENDDHADADGRQCPVESADISEPVQGTVSLPVINYIRAGQFVGNSSLEFVFVRQHSHGIYCKLENRLLLD